MSFDTEYLDDIAACEKLSFGERDELDNWMQKFEHYRCYPIKGKLVAQEDMPDPTHVISKEELSKHNGEGEVPAKYATAPIYVGAGNKVYDVSFGGVEFYGKGCGYNLFAGRDASRALALVSLDPKEAMNPDISDLDEKRIKVLNDWIKTFSERKKYPVVGVLGK
jgi:membrane-associated progesterone receptor component